MSLQGDLAEIGLRKPEIRIYLFLLQNGPSSPSQVAKGTGIARTNCYHPFRSLSQKSLIRKESNGKHAAYVACDPQALFATLEQKRDVLGRSLPELQALFAKQATKPSIRFFEGFEEVKNIYKESLEAEKIRAIGSVRQLSYIDEKFYVEYIKDLKRHHIVFDDILTYDSKSKGVRELQEALGGLYKVNFLPPKYADVPTDMLLWKDKIALIALREPVFGTILTNSYLGQTFKVIFDVMQTALQD